MVPARCISPIALCLCQAGENKVSAPKIAMIANRGKLFLLNAHWECKYRASPEVPSFRHEFSSD
jgi:hypothetical protein